MEIFLWRDTPTTEIKKLVEKIRTLAEDKGHSLASLERALHLSNGSIRKWESNMPACDKILLVANFLDITADYLLRDEMMLDEAPSEDDISENEKRLLRYYHQIDDVGRDMLLGYAAGLYRVRGE